MDDEKMKRSGFVALMGRPNAGKSTLLNRIVGEKIAIVTQKPQTTRNRIIAIYTEERGQIIFTDTPGIHKPEHTMNREMVSDALKAAKESDIVTVIIDVSVKIGRGDEYLVGLVEEIKKPRILLLNKIDLIKKSELLPIIDRFAEKETFNEIIPLSAAEGDGVDIFIDKIFEYLPISPPLYDEELVTLHTERFLVAEYIREKILNLTREEIPYSTAVIIDSWEEEENLVKIYASIIVERDSQKGILIGKNGRMIKEIGTRARVDIEALLGKKVFLDLHVKCRPKWRENLNLIKQLKQQALPHARKEED